LHSCLTLLLPQQLLAPPHLPPSPPHHPLPRLAEGSSQESPSAAALRSWSPLACGSPTALSSNLERTTDLEIVPPMAQEM
jgi:hypothetical protein